jgi:DNA repair exonuclease SbcCD ATPase subunit
MADPTDMARAATGQRSGRAAVGAGAPAARQRIEVFDVVPATGGSDQLRGARLRQPKPGVIQSRRLTIAGSVQARESRVEYVEVVDGPEIVARAAVKDAATSQDRSTIAGPARKTRSAFQIKMEAAGTGKSDLQVDAILEDGTRAPIATLSVRVSALTGDTARARRRQRRAVSPASSTQAAAELSPASAPDEAVPVQPRTPRPESTAAEASAVDAGEITDFGPADERAVAGDEPRTGRRRLRLWRRWPGKLEELRDQLIRAEADRRQDQEHHRGELESLSAELHATQTAHDAERAELASRLQGATEARRDDEARHRAEVESLSARLREAEEAHAQAAAERAGLESELQADRTELESKLEAAAEARRGDEERHRTELEWLSAKVREAQDARAQTAADRDNLASRLAVASKAHREDELRHRAELESLSARLREAQARRAWKAERDRKLRASRAECAELEAKLEAAVEARRKDEERHRAEQEG